MSPSLLQAHHHRPGGIPFPHHSTAGARPNVRRWWQRNRRIIWPATECHRSDTKEGHSCCARRLECKSGQGCLWQLARHLRTLLQWRHRLMREDSDSFRGISTNITPSWIYWWSAPNSYEHQFLFVVWYFSIDFQIAVVKSLLKKASLDPNNLKKLPACFQPLFYVKNHREGCSTAAASLSHWT